MSGQRSDWRERLRANPSRMEQELAIKLQDNGIQYLTQVEIPVTTADFYFPVQPRPLLVFVDGRVHLGKAQSVKDLCFHAWPGARVLGGPRGLEKECLEKKDSPGILKILVGEAQRAG